MPRAGSGKPVIGVPNVPLLLAGRSGVSYARNDICAKKTSWAEGGMRSPVETMRGGPSTSLAERRKRTRACGTLKKKKIGEIRWRIGTVFCSQVSHNHDCPDHLGMD